MVRTKGLAATRKAWEDAIARVPAKYQEGVEAAQDVIERSKAAEDLWIAKIQDAAARRAREKGLAEVSDADWKKAALEKGAPRIAQGMQAAKEKFGSKISEVLSTIESVSLPPRVADPEANVDNRVKPIVRALHEKFKG